MNKNVTFSTLYAWDFCHSLKVICFLEVIFPNSEYKIKGLILIRSYESSQFKIRTVDTVTTRTLNRIFNKRKQPP